MSTEDIEQTIRTGIAAHGLMHANKVATPDQLALLMAQNNIAITPEDAESLFCEFSGVIAQDTVR